MTSRRGAFRAMLIGSLLAVAPRARAQPAPAAEDLGTGLPAASAAPADEADTGTIDVTGWLRDAVSVDRPRPDGPEHPPELTPPHDLLTNRAALYLSVHRRRAGSALVASGALEHRLLVNDGRSRYDTDNQGVYGRRYEFTQRLVELYGALYTGPVDLTIGQQRVAWGRNELLGINDVIDARDLRDPLLVPEELRYLSMPALRGDVSHDWWSLQLTFIPFFRPHAFDFFGTNWALVQSGAPAAYVAVLNALPPSSGASALFSPDRAVKDDLSQSAVALRWRWTIGSLEVNHYYHYGLDQTPRWTFSQQQLAALEDPALQLDPGARAAAFGAFAATVSVQYQRRHHLGLSVSGESGPFLLYGEGAFESSKVFITSDLHTVARPWWVAAVGAEYQGDIDRVVDLALEYGRAVLEEGDGTLLWYQRNNLNAAISAQWRLWDQVSAEARGIAGIIPAGISGRLGLRWKRNHWAVAAGAAVLTGSNLSFGGYYRANQGLYVDVKRLF